MTLRKAPYHPSKPHDDGLSFVVETLQKHMRAAEDDGLLVITGAPGTGKSMLAMHLVSRYSKKPKAEQFALTQESFARAHQRAKEASLRKDYDGAFVVYDEADVNRRASLTQWNRDLINLYMTNRVFQLLHVWCWPSLHLLDQAFVQERITGVFFIATKDKDRPRRYVYYPRASLLKMVDAGINLTHHALKKHASKYGYYVGWFRKYEGELLEAYKEIKIESAGQIDESFHEKYAKGRKRYSLQKAAATIGVGFNTARKALMSALALGLIEESTVRTPTGQYNLSENDLPTLKTIIQERRYVGEAREER